MAGVDLRTVQELMGHKSIEMTVRYSHLAPKHTLAAVERLATTKNQLATVSTDEVSDSQSDLVTSKDIYLWFAGIGGSAAASLFKGSFGKNGKLTDSGKGIAKEFTSNGVVVGVNGRPLANQPANLANGDSVYSVIAYNTGAVGNETNVSYLGVDYESIPSNVVSAEIAGLGKTIPAVGLFIHESAEALAFRDYGNFDAGSYPFAHSRAILREATIREELHIAGGFAGAWVTYAVNH